MAETGVQEQAAVAPGGLGEARLVIDCGSGQVLDANEAAACLFAMVRSDLAGMAWNSLLDSPSASVLSHALTAGKRLSLPPFILRRADGAELVVGGLVLPVAGSAAASAHLLLWPLLADTDLSAAAQLEPSDTLAVLGVDQLRYDQDWGRSECNSLMAEIHSSLLEIVRSQDIVGSPVGTAVIMILRDVDIDAARDISRALLSHLHRIQTVSGLLVDDARTCIGLAKMTRGLSPLATLLAANNALELVRCDGGGELIRAAAADDNSVISARTMNAHGAFSEAHSVQDAAEAGQPIDSEKSAPAVAAPPIAPIERDIEGYVVDNMEGAVDQAIFMARLDIPVAIIGPAGTGKMYVARIIHEESGAAPDMLVPVDCREFRSRNSANATLARELADGEGKTLVFKSPHLMHADVQAKLARQISSRVQADVSPPQYLPQMKLIALFPDALETLVRRGQLTESLASVFAGYPINVPPIRDRKQAVLRWAHKILVQEGSDRDRDMKGFTPDAEQAMLLYDWPGNISEMRQCIYDALEKTDKGWLTPVDLGLFKGIKPDGAPYLPESKPFLAIVENEDSEEETYVASSLEAVELGLGEAVHNLLELNLIKPLGTWLEDELVVAALDRYRGDQRRAAEFLSTKPRNISRWLPRIQAREEERNTSALWQKPRRMLREWVRETSQLEDSALVLMQDKLLAHVNEQCGALTTAKRAKLMGVSTPTYLKRMREGAGE